MPALTTSGSPTLNGNGSVTIDSTGADRVQAPVALTDETQGWFACRCVNPTVTAGVIKNIFAFGDNASNLLRLYKGETAQGGQFRMNRLLAGSGVEAVGINQTGTDMTVIGKWTATQVGISVNGAAFILAGNTTIPTVAATTFDIGNFAAGSQIGTAIWWCAAGTGPFTDADAAALNSYGNVEPVWGEVPGSTVLTFLWSADDFNYLNAAPPTVPTAPQSLSATGSDSQVALSWSAPASDGGSAITGYKIYRSVSPGGETLLASPAGVGTTYTDSAVINGITYYYKVSAVNAVGETLSGEVSGTPTSPLVANAVRTHKRLYGPDLLGITPVTLYTVPASTTTVIRHIHVSNPSGLPQPLTLSIGADTAGRRLWDGEALPPGDFIDHISEHIMTEAEVIQAFAGTAATLNLTVDGYELSNAYVPAPPDIVYPGANVFPSDFPAYPADDLFPH